MCNKRVYSKDISLPYPTVDTDSDEENDIDDEEVLEIEHILLRNEEEQLHLRNELLRLSNIQLDLISSIYLTELRRIFQPIRNETNENASAPSAAPVTINLDTAEIHDTDQH